MTIKISSPDTLILYFGNHISEEILSEVQRAYRALRSMKGIIDLVPSYTSLLIHYDITLYSPATLSQRIQETLNAQHDQEREKKSKLIEIPTIYDNARALDLQCVANHNKLSIDRVIELHTQSIYRVYTIGFMVGFAYLGRVDSHIQTPRLSTPRAKVPKGSVAIAEYQTAIYPQDSAGGWNIIGHTEFDDFESFEVGDSVQFMRIG